MLKQLMLSRKISAKRAQLAELKEKRKALRARRAELKKREEELEAELKDVVEEAAQAEAEAVVDEVVEQIDQVETETDENAEAIEQLETEIEEMQAQLDEIDAAATGDDAPEDEGAGEETASRAANTENRRIRTMNNTVFDRRRQRLEVIRSAMGDADMKAFVARIRAGMGSEKRAVAGGSYTIPQSMLPLIKEIVEENSKLLKYFTLHSAKGTTRQPIMGTIPPAVWTEMTGSINEMDLIFNQTEMDGWKVAAFVPLHNSIIQDNDVNLVGNVIFALGRGTGLAMDMAFLYGTGVKMPLGIVPRLLQTSAPADYPSDDRPWVDLHTSNVQVISAANSKGLVLFQSLITVFGAAKKNWGADGKFWAMNEKTHMRLLAEALNFNANGAIVAGLDNTMPVVGGPIEELDFMPDGVIIAGYGSNYGVLERRGLEIAQSEHALFLQDMTVWRATSRYDGKPVIPEGFVAIAIDGGSVAGDAVSFLPDEANSVKGIQLNTATASVVVGAETQLLATTYPGSGAVTWTSATPAKATVDANGVVTGVAAGSSVITAACDGMTATCTVTVTAS